MCYYVILVWISYNSPHKRNCSLIFGIDGFRTSDGLNFFTIKKPNTSRSENIFTNTVNKRFSNTEAGREGFHSEHICFHYGQLWGEPLRAGTAESSNRLIWVSRLSAVGVGWEPPSGRVGEGAVPRRQTHPLTWPRLQHTMCLESTEGLMTR